MSAMRTQLTAMRAGAAAIGAQADALLEAMGTAPDEPAVGAIPPLTPLSPCPHPAASRLSAPRMGALNAWLCVACGGSSDSSPTPAELPVHATEEG